MPAVPGAVEDPSSLETAEVSFTGFDRDELNGYLAVPASDELRPGLIVIHEAFGLNDHICDVARRFAAQGYTVLAPDLYTREGAPGEDWEQIKAKMQKMPDKRIVGDLEGAAAFLRVRPEATGKVGCIGFCSGGRQTLLFACSSDAPDAAVDCWGGSITRATTCSQPGMIDSG